MIMEQEQGINFNQINLASDDETIENISLLNSITVNKKILAL